MTGDSNDILSRIKGVLPDRWFNQTAPYRDAILGGIADAFAWVYSMIQFAKLQTRIQTSTDLWLDLVALDYFGLHLQRSLGQSDASFRARIQAELLRERVTRKGMSRAITDLTQQPVTIFEPWNPGDTGGFNAQWAFNEPRSAFGSSAYPYQSFITVVEPGNAGIANESGFNNAQSGFGAGEFFLADLGLIKGAVTTQNIYDAINATRATGTVCWVSIGPPPVVGGRLDMSFYLDQTPLA